MLQICRCKNCNNSQVSRSKTNG